MNEFLREGVYCFLGGPSFETVTECRFLKVAGVDATGIVKWTLFLLLLSIKSHYPDVSNKTKNQCDKN